MKALVTRHIPPRAAVVVIALALAASVVVGREKPSQAAPQPAERLAERVRAEPAQEIALDLEALDRREKMTTGAGDPFSPKSFAPSAPPAPAQAAAPAAPAKPSAPALPFRYVGKVIEDGRLTVFLARGDSSQLARPGEQLDGEYRLDDVSDTTLSFTYLPLGTKQTLALPGVNG